MAGNTDVVVIGGGHAGVMAANRRTQRDDAAVTLVNPRQRFVERIRLHQLVAGTHEAVVDYREGCWASVSGWWSTPCPGSTLPSAAWSWRAAARSATTTWSTRRAVAAPMRVCGERPSSRIRSPLWRRCSGCGRSSTPRPPRPL